MSSQAQQMQELMSFFKLAKTDHSSNYGFAAKKTKTPIYNQQATQKKTAIKQEQTKKQFAHGTKNNVVLNMGDDQFESF